MSKTKDMQAIIRHFREQTGKKEIHMHEVAAWAVKRGWRLPKPVDPLDRLAEQFSRAAREETRTDTRTGRPYRVNHAVTDSQTNFTFWIDIEQAPRKQMHRSLTLRREQSIGDVVQMTLDALYWNSINETQEPIAIDADFTLDVAWRLATPTNDKAEPANDEAEHAETADALTREGLAGNDAGKTKSLDRVNDRSSS